jgi:acetyltransferase-like isoleucine patch superfamily enzyme
LFNTVRFYRQEKRAAKRGVVIKGFERITKRSHLLLEQHTKLRHVHVELPEAGTPLRIGAHSYIRSDSRLMYVSDIGRFCCIGRGITIGETPRNHPVDWVSVSLVISAGYVAQHDYTVIGHDVWIGHDAVIMAGVKVGHGAIIGRNAVVTKDVEPYQIVAGNPAKPIRYRFEKEQREALLASKWWEKDVSALTQLSCDDVDKFLQEIGSLSDAAQYAVVEVKRGKVV